MSVLRLSHIGICVAELDRSVRFYRDVFGFRELTRLEVEGAESEQLIELPDGKLQAVYLERDNTRIELLYFPKAGHIPVDGPRPMNLAGLTHLSFRVDDVDATLAAVEAAGGRCLSATRIGDREFGWGAIFVTDPDGMRIELLQSPGDPNSLPGA